jgi:hypothetical protein
MLKTQLQLTGKPQQQWIVLWRILALKVPEEDVLCADVEPARVLLGAGVTEGGILLLFDSNGMVRQLAVVCPETLGLGYILEGNLRDGGGACEQAEEGDSHDALGR